MTRPLWKGALALGRLNIPVALRPASRNQALDFDWLDRRDMAPVGYQRINKRTGQPVAPEDIVKGYQYEPGDYVLLSDEDFRQAHPHGTQAVELLGFAKLAEISPVYFDTPYFLEAAERGEKGYVLLRETLRKTGRVALARVVIHGRQHLAAVLVSDQTLVLNTLRFHEEVLPGDDLNVPKDDAAAIGLTAEELDTAARLVRRMTRRFTPADYVDTYRADLLARIESKIEAGETHSLMPEPPSPDAEEAPELADAGTDDLLSALKESLKGPARRSQKHAGPKPAPAPGNARR